MCLWYRGEATSHALTSSGSATFAAVWLAGNSLPLIIAHRLFFKLQANTGPGEHRGNELLLGRFKSHVRRFLTRPPEPSVRLRLVPSALLLVQCSGLWASFSTMQMLLPLRRIFGNFTLPSAGSLHSLSAFRHRPRWAFYVCYAHLGHLFENHVCALISTNV